MNNKLDQLRNEVKKLEIEMGNIMINVNNYEDRVNNLKSYTVSNIQIDEIYGEIYSLETKYKILKVEKDKIEEEIKRITPKR